MYVSDNGKPSLINNQSDCDRPKELKAFDETKEGVKGLVDAGIVKIPKIFIHPPDQLAKDLSYSCNNDLQVPVIDLRGIRSTNDHQHKKIVDKVRIASKSWGFFQVVNHGIPISLLEKMIEGMRESNLTT
ncbi:1-aminocyclopropane-1-carboxylate oxidase [Quillaja saponaria]|uniref:1-aminocyclopropane-1-carboxylate oxidase n=1 Tax=Quillaja saponaria TaxID=32244 RepID=A0AAD7PH80_QUISA|nr:1-aminocyclopropane-1-carboxylate oxidase [Quillaja saponaria]